MGMFDNTYGVKDYSKTSLAAEAGKNLGRLVGGALGMEHEEDRVLSVMQSVNPDNLDSVIAGYKKIMAINPDAAVEFKAQMMPFIKSRQTQTQLDATAAQARKTATPKQSTFMANVEYNKSFVKQQNPGFTDLQVEEEARRMAKDKGADVAEQEAGKLFSKYNSDTLSKIPVLRKNINEMNRMGALLDSGVWTGIGQKPFSVVKRALAALGVDVEGTANMEELNSLGTSFLNEQVNLANGTQTDPDVIRAGETVFSMTKTNSGNKLRLDFIKAAKELEIATAKEQARWTNMMREKSPPRTPTHSLWIERRDEWLAENKLNHKEKFAEFERKAGAPTETTDKPTETQDKPKIPTTASVNDSYAKFKEAKKKQIEELNLTPVEDNRTPFEKYGKEPNYVPPPSEVALAKQLLRDTGATQYPQQSFQQPIQNYQQPQVQPQVQPQPQQYQGLLTNGNISALDAVKNAVLNGPSPTGLLQQRMQQTSTDQLANRRKQQEVMQQKARFRQAQQKQAENTNGKPITSWDKVRVQKLSAQEREMWKDFIKSVPADMSGKRPKGWLVPFQKMICENRPECTL